MKVPYTDLATQIRPLKRNFSKALESVIESGNYVLGKELENFEYKFSAYLNSTYGIGVANGTSALYLSLKSLGIGAGDEVITTPHSYFATASSIILSGADPVFVDISDDLNIDSDLIENAITAKTKAIMPVHIAGRPANMDKITLIAKENKLKIIEDTAQSVGAKYKNRFVGTLGDVGCFSLHPLKNLFAIGDGGMIVTNNKDMKNNLIILRNHGHKTRDIIERWSFNERLDELQASFLNISIDYLDEWTKKRRKKAELYNDCLSEIVRVPKEGNDEYCVYQTYVIKADKRDDLKKYLYENGITALIHYPIPIHLQPPLRSKNIKLKNAEKISNEILSLPLFPTMNNNQQEYIIEKIKKFYKL